jgi:hypothetical protein
VTLQKLQLLRIWHSRLILTSTAHYRVSETYERRGRAYTQLNVIFATAVLFFSNSHLLEAFVSVPYVGFFLSIAGLGTVLTATLQYINRYEERAAQHKLAGSEYSILKRNIERRLAAGAADEVVEERLQLDYDLLAKHCPLVEHKFWKGVVEAVQPHKKREEAFFSYFDTTQIERIIDGKEEE